MMTQWQISYPKICVTIVCILLLAGFQGWGQSGKANPYHLQIIQTPSEYKALVKNKPAMEMVDLSTFDPRIWLDIRYSTAHNFTGKVIYTASKAFTRIEVARALKKVEDSLAWYHLSLKIYDAYRPYAATLKFYEVYPDTTFVANPRYGSRHNRGCAVDVTLAESATGKEIPMPSEFDDFSPRAHPAYSNLPDTVKANRTLLFGIMKHFGFSHYESEWWHFDFHGWDSYPLMDLTFDELKSTR